jgi:uncharacterized membrane protein YhaH (DUF805 family)
MGFQKAVATCFRKYAVSAGRATRSEFWYFVLFIFLVSGILTVADGMIFGREYADPQLLSGIFSLGVFIPSWAVNIRRLHDIDKSGWWILLNVIPVIGSIILIYWACKPGTGPNRYGPVPEGAAAAQAAACQ